MQKAVLIAAAFVIAVAAAGAYFWLSQQNSTGDAGGGEAVTPGPTESATAPTAVETSLEAKLVSDMTSATSTGGIAATFGEADMKHWKLPSGQKFERFSVGETDSVFGRLTSGSPLDRKSNQWPELGLSYALPLSFANKTNGSKVEVAIIARTAQSNGSSQINIVYATQQAGNSGWKSFDLDGEFKLFKFEFEVPKVETGYTNPPILVVHSDSSGAGQSVEIIGAYVKPL